ncbi:MAG: helix-turn-helix domain-containing protein [Octadecabacter sp.]|nr:helix-turn-helix domain-containing protein [Octadecabacter sp.]
MGKRNTSGESPTVPTVVKPVANAVALLRHLGATGKAETVTQLARVTGINTSTCFNILRTLVAERMLVFDDSAKTYQIGLGAVELAQHALNDGGKAEVLRPLVEAVARRHGITLTLWRLGEVDRHLLIGAAETDSPFRIQLEIGLQSPLYAGAIGRSLVHERGLSDAEVGRVYQTLHWAREPGLEAFKTQVAEAEFRGWGIDDGYFARGVLNLGVIVPRQNGRARYGLVGSMFQGQMSEAEADAIGRGMVELATEISGID